MKIELRPLGHPTPPIGTVTKEVQLAVGIAMEELGYAEAHCNRSGALSYLKYPSARETTLIADARAIGSIAALAERVFEIGTGKKSPVLVEPFLEPWKIVDHDSVVVKLRERATKHSLSPDVSERFRDHTGGNDVPKP